MELNVTDMAGSYNTTTVTVEVVETISEFSLLLPVIAMMMLVSLIHGVRRRKKTP